MAEDCVVGVRGQVGASAAAAGRGWAAEIAQFVVMRWAVSGLAA